MKHLNIIIDFNNIANRAMFTCQYVEGTNIVNFDTEEECSVLMRKIATDVSAILRLMRPDRTIFVCDSKNLWRNKIYDTIEGERYKGTRKKDDTKNWKNIYNTFDEFKNILREKGFIVSEQDNTEADDLSAMWISRLYKNSGENVILVSSDRDWTQQLDFNIANKSFVVCFNPTINNKRQKKLYGTKEFFEWLNSVDAPDIFFKNADPSKQIIIDSMKIDTRIVPEELVPGDVLLDKILCGDDSDNVPAFYDFYKNGKKMRLTQLKAKKLCESMDIKNLNDLKSVVNTPTFLTELENGLKIHIGDMDPSERLLRQRMLVELNPELFPEKVRMDFDKKFPDYDSVGYVDVRNINCNDMLKNTRFLDKNFNKPKENSIFAEVLNAGALSTPLKLW